MAFTEAMKAKERQAAVDRLATTDYAQPLLVLGTGSYIGEGFDCPKLDTLFLAAPVSFKGRLVQQAQKLMTSSPGPQAAVSALPQLLGTVFPRGHRRAAGYVSRPEGGDRRPGEPTAKAHTSKSAPLGQVTGSDVQSHRHRQEISAGRDFVVSHDAGLPKRLEDA